MKKVVLGVIGVGLGLIGLASIGTSNALPSSSNVNSSVEATATPVVTPVSAVKTTPSISPSSSPEQVIVAPVATPVSTNTPAASSLSNDDYYTNVDGNSVHAPAMSNSVPAGASAVCGDGSYSFSQHRSGTCSHHGGVARWL